MSNPGQRGSHNVFSKDQNLYALYEVDEALINLRNFQKLCSQTIAQAVLLNGPRLVIWSHRRAGREIGEVVLICSNFKIHFSVKAKTYVFCIKLIKR